MALVVKNPPANPGDTRPTGLIPGSGRFPWWRKWQPTPALLSGESHGQRSLVGYRPWDHKESDTTEHSSWVLMPLLNWSAKNSRITEEKIKGPQNPSFASRTRHVQSPSFQSAGLTYKPDAFQNDPLVQLSPKQTQRELHSIFCNNLEGKRIWKRIYIYIYKTNTFQTNYTSIKKKNTWFYLQGGCLYLY